MSDLVRNEQAKLSANLLNAIASGMFITGVVAPIVAVLYGVPGPAQANPWVVGIASGAWLAGSIILHGAGRALLRRLR